MCLFRFVVVVVVVQTALETINFWPRGHGTGFVSKPTDAVLWGFEFRLRLTLLG